MSSITYPDLLATIGGGVLLLRGRDGRKGKVKVKGKWSIAVRKTPHCYGNSRAIWYHKVLPATRQR